MITVCDQATQSCDWGHTTGSYQKRLSDYLGIKAPAPSSVLPQSLWEFFAPGAAKVATAVTYASAASVLFPVYYIKVTNLTTGAEYFAEWPFSAAARDAAYAIFQPNFAVASNAARLQLIKTLQAAPGSPSPQTLAKWKGVVTVDQAKKTVGQLAYKQGAAGATNAVLPLVIGGVVIALLFR